jgi:ribosomal protein S12 methylthiotransferase accessory factor
LLPVWRRVIASAAVSLTDLVDSRVGIVRSCTRLAKDRKEPTLPIVYQATLSNFDFRRAPDLERIATGKGLGDASAERGAVIEALERYCACQMRADALVFGSSGTLDGASIEPEELVLYSERQYEAQRFPYRRPVAGEELTWVRGTLLDSGEAVYAPASLVYLNFAGAGGHERFTTMTSSGLAGGDDLPSAVLAGMYELVERDAFVITWLNRLPAPRIDFPETAGFSSDARRHYRRFGIETHAFDLTTDLGIPVVMAVAVDRSGETPAVTVGLGCNLHPAVALERAVMEVAQVRVGSVPRYRSAQAPPLPRRYDDVRTLEDHAAFAASREYLDELDFLLDSVDSQSLGDLPDQSRGTVEMDLYLCGKRLEHAGCTVAFVDLTQPDLDPLGVRIVRAIATGLQPIHFGSGEEHLGGKRLFSVPRLLGHATRDTTEADLNPCPHPLA